MRFDWRDPRNQLLVLLAGITVLLLTLVGLTAALVAQGPSRSIVTVTGASTTDKSAPLTSNSTPAPSATSSSTSTSAPIAVPEPFTGNPFEEPKTLNSGSYGIEYKSITCNGQLVPVDLKPGETTLFDGTKVNVTSKVDSIDEQTSFDVTADLAAGTSVPGYVVHMYRTYGGYNLNDTAQAMHTGNGGHLQLTLNTGDYTSYPSLEEITGVTLCLAA